MLLHDEIGQQPAILAGLLDRFAAESNELGTVLRRPDVTHAVIAARGTSDNAARYAKYVWGTRLGLPVTLAAPSMYTKYDAPPRLTGSAVVAISQSGQSPDLLSVVEEARRQGRPTVAIVNDETSPLATMADIVFPLGAGTEGSVAATKSYTASLLAVAMAAADPAAFAHLPDVVAGVLSTEPLIEEAIARRGPMGRAVVLGRGYNHATAFEWALKLQEMAYVFAHGFSTADFAHGPFAVLEPGFPVLALVPDGPTMADSVAILERARDEGGADVSVIATSQLVGFDTIRLPEIDEWLSPIPFIVGAQLATLHIAALNGVDPEQPRGLRKITKTT